MRFFESIATSILCAVSIGISNAEEVTPKCKVINWSQDRIYTIKSGLHKATHVIFPEPIVAGPVVGNKDLWDVERMANHLFVKPNSESPEGSETTITVIGESNTSYEFLINRDASPEACIRINKPGKFGDKSSVSFFPPDNRNPAILNKRISELESRLSKEKNERCDEIDKTLDNYRDHIYTRYSWPYQGGFFSEGFLSDVWDDGRFTYIRVNSDNKGLVTVSAKVNGKKEFIEYKYNSDKKEYKMSGIYEELVLQYSGKTIRVKRGDPCSTGGY